jgi:hypothetical protein
MASAYLVLLTGTLVLGWRWIGDAHVPREYREARERGVPGTAVVLEVEATGWQSGRTGRRSLRLPARAVRHEYVLRLRLEGTYEARTSAFLTAEEAPAAGATVAVLVHPQRPDVVVLATPGR